MKRCQQHRVKQRGGAGFPGHASSRWRQQRRYPKPKQQSHLRSSLAFGFLRLLSFLTNMQSISPRRSFLSRYFPIKHLSGRTAGRGRRETLGREQQLRRAGRLWAAWVGCWLRLALGEGQWLRAVTFTAVLPSYHSTVLTPTDARATLALILQSRRTSLFRMQGGRNDIDENIGRFPPKSWPSSYSVKKSNSVFSTQVTGTVALRLKTAKIYNFFFL